MGKAVVSRWTDSSLEDNVDIYGQQWKKGRFLSIVIGREFHRSSQMTIIMRAVALPVPGIYGPPKDKRVAMSC